MFREVQEEVGLEVESIEYMASQPWPFPNSLMVGFHVTVTSNIITIDEEELSNAHWFTPEEIQLLDDWGEIGDKL